MKSELHERSGPANNDSASLGMILPCHDFGRALRLRKNSTRTSRNFRQANQPRNMRITRKDNEGESDFPRVPCIPRFIDALVTGLSRFCRRFVTGQKSLKFPSEYSFVTLSRVKSPPPRAHYYCPPPMLVLPSSALAFPPGSPTHLSHLVTPCHTPPGVEIFWCQ